MTMKLDPAAGAASPPADRQHARARQDRWELEVERALLASGQRSAGQRDDDIHEAAPRARTGAAGSGEAMLPETRRGHAATLAHQVGPDDADGVRDEAAGKSNGGGAASQSAPGVAADADDERMRDAVERASGAPAAAGNAMPWGHAPVAGIAPPAMQGVAGFSSAPRVGAAGVGSPAPFAGATAAALPAAPLGAALAFAAPAQTTSGGARQAAPASELGAEIEGQGAQSGTAARSPAHAEEPFALRHLHLIRRDDGIHAFIRDAILGAGQARAVAHAMAWEFAQQGSALSAVTINGRLFRQEAVGAQARSGERGQWRTDAPDEQKVKGVM